MDENHDESERAGVQSVGIGLKVARAFIGTNGPLALKDAARIANLRPSAAHRYLVSLVRAGLMIQLDDQQYDLGPLALQLGFAALARIDAVTTAADWLKKFVHHTGTTAMLTIWSKHGPVIVRWRQGVHPVFTTLTVGSTLPLTTTASGRIFLAFSDPNLTQSVLGFEKNQDIDFIRKEVRRQSYSLIAGDFIPGLHAAAAPVFDGTGELVAVMSAVSAGAPLEQKIVVQLCKHADAASDALGRCKQS
jgi:DNA-binding IclR family transcriptional regulator